MTTLPYPHGTGPGEIGEGANISTTPIPGTTGGMMLEPNAELTSAKLNRGPYAVNANVDHIWSRMKADTHPLARKATVSRTSAGDSGYQFSGQVYCGNPSTSSPEQIFQVFESTGTGPLIVNGQLVKVTAVRDGPGGLSVLGTGFQNNPWVDFNVSIPAGVDYIVLYGARDDLDELDVEAMYDIPRANQIGLKIFGDVADGLANTSEGEIFAVINDYQPFQELWRVDYPDIDLISYHLASNGRYLVLADDHDVYIVDLTNGQQVGHYHSVAAMDGHVAINQKNAFVATGAQVLKLDWAGNVVSAFGVSCDECRLQATNKHVVYAVRISTTATIHVYDADTGSHLWSSVSAGSTNSLFDLMVDGDMAALNIPNNSSSTRIITISLIPNVTRRSYTSGVVWNPGGHFVIHKGLLYGFDSPTNIRGYWKQEGTGSISTSIRTIAYAYQSGLDDLFIGPDGEVWSYGLYSAGSTWSHQLVRLDFTYRGPRGYGRIFTPDPPSASVRRAVAFDLHSAYTRDGTELVRMALPSVPGLWKHVRSDEPLWVKPEQVGIPADWRF